MDLFSQGSGSRSEYVTQNKPRAPLHRCNSLFFFPRAIVLSLPPFLSLIAMTFCRNSSCHGLSLILGFERHRTCHTLPYRHHSFFRKVFFSLISCPGRNEIDPRDFFATRPAVEGRTFVPSLFHTFRSFLSFVRPFSIARCPP